MTHVAAFPDPACRAMPLPRAPEIGAARTCARPDAWNELREDMESTTRPGAHWDLDSRAWSKTIVERGWTTLKWDDIANFVSTITPKKKDLPWLPWIDAQYIPTMCCLGDFGGIYDRGKGLLLVHSWWVTRSQVGMDTTHPHKHIVSYICNHRSIFNSVE